MKNKMIKLRIDGIEVEVEKGRTILEAAQSAGIRIPTLCHDPRLTPLGACNLCVVQEKGKSELLPACFTPATGGMEIVTQSPEIFESRRLQLELLLLNHPMNCPWCEKESECALQNLVYEYGVGETRFPWERILFPVDDLSPLLKRDSNKCILCGRCVRICDEIQGVGELSFTQRGTKTTIDTDFHRSIQCEFCGQCMDTCPVGAITSDRFDYTTKAWELDETTTSCPYCACGCLLTMGSKEGVVKRIFAGAEEGPNDGALCVKGRFGWDFIDHPERLKTPLLRINGILKEVGWEEALQWVAKELKAIRDQEGPDAIAGVASSRLTNEEYYLFGKLFRTALRTNQIDQGADTTYQGLTEGLGKTLGVAASTNSIQEIRKADSILVIGVDPSQTHPVVKNEIHQAIRRNRAQLIVLGSYDIGLSQSSQISPLSPPPILLLERPGTEVALVNGMIGTIFKEGLEDKEFIEEKTEGIEDLKQNLASLHESWWEWVSEKKRIEVEKAARAFAKAKRAMILIGSGRWSHLNQKEVAIASSNLALITGHIGKESCGILTLLEKCNSQGAVDMGIISQGEEHPFHKVKEGKVKALYIVGEDPLLASSDSDRLAKGLKDLRLLVVQDLFMTETAKRAGVVLPACSFVEKDGTFTNLERRVQRLSPVRSPRDGSKSDFEIFIQLLHLLECPVPGETPDAIFEDISRSLPHYMNGKDGRQWPNGLPYLYSDGFPKGKAKLLPVSETYIDPVSDGHLQLIQRPSLFRSGLLSSKSDALRIVSEEPHLEMNPEDGQRLKIEEGEIVQLTADGGRSLRMKVMFSPTLVSGAVTAPYPCPLIGEEGISLAKVERVTY